MTDEKKAAETKVKKLAGYVFLPLEECLLQRFCQ